LPISAITAPPTTLPTDAAGPKFEAVSQLPENEQAIVREVLESLIIKYQSRRWDSSRKTAKEE